MKKEALVGVVEPQIKEYSDLPEAQRGTEAYYPTAFRGSMALPTLRVCTSGFKSCERINVCVNLC